ncbi:MAG TPA: hypothetical protein VJT72_13010 [Pseudonocardiaceae bacterium]|nr:hypothetical protein [Pseudonocardiaceae bacterium]
MVKAPFVPHTTAAFAGSAIAPRIVTMVAASKPVAPVAATDLDMDVLKRRFKEIDIASPGRCK